MTEDRKAKVPFREAMGLLRRTTPFLFLNVLVYGGFFVATVLWLALWGGIAVFMAERVELLAVIALLIAVVTPAAVLRLAKRYILYLVQGAHIAVATKLLLEGEIPEGKGQVEYGREVVKANFRDVSILFAVDRVVYRVARAFVRSFVRIVDIMPLGGAVSQIARWVGQILRRSASYIDQAILSYAIALNEPTVWRSARHGLILYAQSYKPILAAAAKIWVLGRVVFLVALVGFGLPAAALMFALDAIWFQIAAVVGVVLMAHLFVLAVFEPFATIYTLATYHRAIVGVEVNATWDERLQSVSKAFRDLVGHAREESTEPDPVDQMHPAPQADGPPGAPAPGPVQSSRPGAAPGRGTGGGLGGALTGGAVGGLLGKALSATQQSGQPTAPAGPGQAPAGDEGDDPPAA